MSKVVISAGFRLADFSSEVLPLSKCMYLSISIAEIVYRVPVNSQQISQLVILSSYEAARRLTDT
ncbi:MAG: hypothetical protein ICPDIFCJ_00567 [Sodalis sp. Ppy]|nr:hypothetical protein [Sodalis sp. Ppy]